MIIHCLIDQYFPMKNQRQGIDVIHIGNTKRIGIGLGVKNHMYLGSN